MFMSLFFKVAFNAAVSSTKYFNFELSILNIVEKYYLTIETTK
jgi:hypothetical protein